MKRRCNSIHIFSFLITIIIWAQLHAISAAVTCPPSSKIFPCRCSMSEKEIKIRCAFSNLPLIMDCIKALEHYMKGNIDELVLENNRLPVLPSGFFGNLQIVRLELRNNGIEHISNDWLNEQTSLVYIYIAEPKLRSMPMESLNGMCHTH